MKHNLNTLKMMVYTVILIGVFTGIIGAASASTTIKVADNGHYFEYNGKPVFLLGLGNWVPVRQPDFDYVAHNTWYESYGVNFNRITLVYMSDLDTDLYAWKRSTTPGANDGGNKFDLAEFDPAFWNRLKGYLQDCEDKGIIVCIQFFGECAVEAGSNRWHICPFHPQNNINNIPDIDTLDASYSSSNGWSRSFYNVNNSALMTLQDIYVQKLLDETSQYGNVIYEMANEYGGEGSTQFPGHFTWPQHWIDFFSNYETANGIQLLLTNMPFGGSYDQAEYFAASGIDCIDATRQAVWSADRQQINDFVRAHYNKRKPIFLAKIGGDVGLEGGNLNENRKRIWTLFASGGAGAGFNGCNLNNEWDDDTTQEKMMSDLLKFIESGVEFWKMSPKDNLVTSGKGYCLADRGEEYLVYLPNGGSVTVDLSDATGTLKVEWYDPKDGTYYAEGTVTGRGNKSFTSPFSGDAVLHILSTVFDTGKGTYPSITGTYNGTIKPTDDITVQKMYTYPCPGTGGHSEYMRLWNASGTIAEENWSSYEGDWHNITFSDSFTLKSGETYNYTIRTGSYPQIIHVHTANVTGGTITCGKFLDANGKGYNDWIPAIKLYSTGVASASASISDDMVHAGGKTESSAIVLCNSCNSAVNGLFKALKSIRGLYNRLFYASKLI